MPQFLGINCGMKYEIRGVHDLFRRNAVGNENYEIKENNAGTNVEAEVTSEVKPETSDNSKVSQASKDAENDVLKTSSESASETKFEGTSENNAETKSEQKSENITGAETEEKNAEKVAELKSTPTESDKTATDKLEPEKTEPAVELDESDDGLETVDLNATDYGFKKESNSSEKNHTAKEKDNDGEEEHRPVRKREKKQVDQYKKKRVRKRIRLLVILAILAGIGCFVYFKVVKPAKEAAENMLNQMVEQTDIIEKRDITEAITTTGTIMAAEVRTLTSTAKDTTIDAVMASVGDTVKEGDTMVMFSTDNINKTITQLQEDLAKQRRKDAIDSQANDRSYLFTYANQSTELSTAAEKVNTTLKALYEACDGYGNAKRELQTAKDEGKDEATIAALESRVSSAYQTEQSAQTSYDAAVEAQAQLLARTNNTLTEADENREKNAISAGDQATQLSRQIEDYTDKLDNYVITAPISGLVTSVSVEEGNGFSGGTVMVIQNTDTLKISAKIDEYDIPNIKLGQRVVVKTDATRDDELMGYVSFIAPTSTTMSTGGTSSSSAGGTAVSSQSSSTGASFEVEITLITKDERLKIGMSAKLNIVVDQVSDVLTVPYDAISTNSKGENYITIIDDENGIPSPGGDKTAEDGSMPVLTINGENISDGASAKSQSEDKKGDFAEGGFSERGTGGGFDKKGSGKDSQSAMNQNRREIIVTVGMEGDYYTQIISDEVKEGMTVVIPDSGGVGGFDFGAMMGGPGGF